MMAPTKTDEGFGGTAKDLSDGESYECNGEMMDVESYNDCPDSMIESRKRNAWLNTSLRRTQNSSLDNSPNRRWSSFRTSKRPVANVESSKESQLHRSSSFHSSGHCSCNDTFSDNSCDDNIQDLSSKLEMIQQQVKVLTDSNHSTDERYAHVKAENASLQTRIDMLEEQLRDNETRATEKLHEEQRRHRDAVARVEREKQLQLENCNIQIQSLHADVTNLRDELQRHKTINDKLKQEKRDLYEQVKDVEYTLTKTKGQLQALQDQERRQTNEREINAEILNDLSKEIESLRNAVQSPPTSVIMPMEDHTSLMDEYQHEIESLRIENKQLREANDELQSALLSRSVEHGQFLLAAHGTPQESNSLAAEFEAMTQNELQKALFEQQEVNAQLRSYLNEILLNVIENNPQLLEVKSRTSTS